MAQNDQSQIESCYLCRPLSEEFATAARLYAEAVVLLTANAANRSWQEHRWLCHAAEQARRRAEVAGVAFEGHLASHHDRLRQQQPEAEDISRYRSSR